MPKKFVKSLSFLSIMILLLTLLAPSVSIASTNVSTSVKNQKNITADKVSKKVAESFKKEEKVTFLIKLKEQVDTAKAAKNAAKAESKAVQSKYEKRSAVVSSLRAKAFETQHNLKTYLTKEEKAGNAKDIKSFYIVNGMAVTATKEVMEKVASFPEVDKVLPNEVRQLHKVKEKAAGKQTEANASPAATEWNINQVGAPAAWEMGIDGSGTVVASIDTGVQWDHPALKEKYRGYNPSAPNAPDHEFSWFDATANQEAPYDDDGHGTHVTGTMVGAEPNGNNQIGVAPGAKWIAVKAFTANGGTDADLLEAGEWILAPKDAAGNPHPEMAPDVVNNSWGGGSGLDEWYRPMVNAWRAADIFPEFSAGNTTLFNPGGPGSIANPANYPESFATGATDINNQLGSFSLQGPSPYNETKPDISAPGVNIRSSVPGGVYEGGWNGTSMAGPHVSAVAALLRQVDSSITVEEIENVLTTTATPLTDSTFTNSPNNGYGHGLVNAYDAVSSLMTGLGKVKGQVAKEGEDAEAPVMEHTGPAEAFAGMNLPLIVNVSDNISVTNVFLHYQSNGGQWQTAEAARVSGDFLDGNYEAVIPGEALEEGTLVYKWKAVDFGANEVVSEEYEIAVQPGITTGYEQDFESGAAGWTSYGVKNSWEHGAPVNGPGNAASGENVFATNLDGDYENGANMNLLMPPIDLPAEGAAFLQFKQWHELENRYDYGHVFVSTDQETWTQALRVNGVTENWMDGQVDLSGYAGERIYVAFNVTSDGSVVKDGWYIDDVKLSDTPIEIQNKASLGVEGKSATADKASKEKKEKVYPNKIKPAPFTAAKGSTDHAQPAALPMRAEVSIVETGRSTYSSLQDGSYEIVHGAGEFTLQAEAYGFATETMPITIENDGITEANFVLEELPQGTVSGVVTNEATGEPVANATLLLVEDAAITPVQTNEQGEYSIEAYEGDYTLKAMAPSYYAKDTSITIDAEQTTVQNITLKPFIGYPGEIGYDDGTAENARAFNAAGNGWAVKMSLAEGNERAMVTGGLFRFWDTEWPVPGGTEFQVAIYDASGTDGAPGKKLAGPINAEALRNGEWTMVNLLDQGVVVDGDFYMVYIQTKANPNSPGLATDEDGENAGRSWQMVSGAWSPSPAEEGNYMIRAIVDYEVTAPEITSPKDGSFTNKETAVVEGKASPTTTVHIYNGETEAASVQATETGTFRAEVMLNTGENVLTAKSSTDAGMTDASNAVKVTLDKTKPVFTVENPKDGQKLNTEALTVSGTIADDNLDWIKVNGQKAAVKDGKFSKRILLENGENVITVLAADKAGNRLKKTVKVYVKYDAPVIENLKPAEDKYIKSGESVKIEFESEEDLDATFVLHMPLTNARIQNATELPLRETSPGHYEGYYTATSNMKADGARIEVIGKDDFGNETRAVADGKLFINGKKPANK
ncbi:S8 family peptidase [Metabacillus indicus]|uniref:Peptidase S8 n=1 Tax=Metabacillus indicus TaxID=246786 RepID=A0A084H3J8_METID|nr:S8 family peptidase [Metabacillus indicus]KEZ54160.1 peptidase S8 [Metabacillus indicus]